MTTRFVPGFTGSNAPVKGWHFKDAIQPKAEQAPYVDAAAHIELENGVWLDAVGDGNWIEHDGGRSYDWQELVLYEEEEDEDGEIDVIAQVYSFGFVRLG